MHATEYYYYGRHFVQKILKKGANSTFLNDTKIYLFEREMRDMSHLRVSKATVTEQKSTSCFSYKAPPIQMPLPFARSRFHFVSQFITSKQIK